jgi:light-regulated signal transduction histidine kinase (bacteriophytochrome)
VVVVFDRQLKYILINKYAQQVYELDPRHAIGKNLLELFPEAVYDPIYQDLQKSLLGEIIHDPCYRTHSGKILENYYIPLLDKDGITYNLLIIGHDITQKMEASEKLRNLNDALAKSNRDLEQFAYVASHDLQEPLRKIQTYSTLLEKGLDDREASANYISRIISSVVRMRELIRSILHYSQASNVTGNPEMVDLNELIENLKMDYELAIAEKEAEIILNKLPPVEGDKLQLNQLFLNLISNSLKFTERKPVIKIQGTVVEEPDLKDQDPAKPASPYLRITFEDNGIGFEQQFGEKIFTIFQRLHSRNQYPGTGIGLALCKKIVENHKGRISVQSTPGKGTIFEIHLPLSPYGVLAGVES